MEIERDEYPSKAEALEEPPEFDLSCLYDDRFDPSEVTVFDPDSKGIATAWMTADIESAVDLDGAR